MTSGPMTVEQRQLAAEQTEYALRRARYGLWRHWSEAENTALEVLCTLARSFNGEGSFRGYVERNLDRRLLDHYREWTYARRKGQPTMVELVELVDNAPGPAELIVDAETARREVGCLTPYTRSVAALLADGMSKQDVAAVFGCVPSAISHVLRNGRTRIEEHRKVAA